MLPDKFIGQLRCREVLLHTETALRVIFKTSLMDRLSKAHGTREHLT